VGRRTFLRGLAAAATWLALGMPSAAEAGLPESLQADLQHPASGVPGAQVTVGAPVGQEAAVGVNPTSVAHVSMTFSTGQPLAGILGDPVNGLYTTEQPKTVIWELAVMEAIKHALQSGYAVDAVSITENIAGQTPTSDPELIVSAQDWGMRARTPATMSLQQVKSGVLSALPPWAQNVAVVEDAAQERVVTVTAATTPGALRTVSVRDAFATLLAQQNDLTQQGADIGRVVLSVSDVLTGQPLYVAAADGPLGMSTSWVSPLVAGFVDDPPSTSKTPREAQETAADPAGTALGLASSATSGG
jgi:hypothetical protein